MDSLEMFSYSTRTKIDCIWLLEYKPFILANTPCAVSRGEVFICRFGVLLVRWIGRQTVRMLLVMCIRRGCQPLDTNYPAQHKETGGATI